MAATMADMYVPLFGQRLAHLTPVAAGFLGAGLAIGWTVGEISSASLRSTPGDQADRRGRAAGDGHRAGARGADPVRGRHRSAWSRCGRSALLITGAGVGIAWPHLSAWAMSCVDDPAEGPAAAAAINTVQLICGAFGAGLAGVVGQPDRDRRCDAGAVAVRRLRGAGRAGRGRVYEKRTSDRSIDTMTSERMGLPSSSHRYARRLVGTRMPSASTKSEMYWMAENPPAMSTR